MYLKCGKEIKGEITLFELLDCCIKILVLETDEIKRTFYLLLATVTEILETLKCLELKTNRSSLLSLYQEKRIYLGKVLVLYFHTLPEYVPGGGNQNLSLAEGGFLSTNSVQNSTGQIPKQPHPVRLAFEVRWTRHPEVPSNLIYFKGLGFCVVR